MSTLDEIRARNDNQMRMGHRFAPGSVIDDRRTLLALLDAQSLELSATKTSYGLLCDRLETAEKELQAVREALEIASKFLASHAAQHYECDDGFYSCPKHPDYFGNDSRDLCLCRSDEAREILRVVRAALKQSRGAT